MEIKNTTDLAVGESEIRKDNAAPHAVGINNKGSAAILHTEEKPAPNPTKTEEKNALSSLLNVYHCYTITGRRVPEDQMQ